MSPRSAITHAKVLDLPDEGNPNEIQPSDWNAQHALSLTASLLALDGIDPAADMLAYFTGTSAAALTSLTAFARTMLAIGNAAAWRTQLGAAALDSPSFVNSPTAPTAAPGTNNQLIANTAFVQAAITALINGSPGALDTLKELADALGDDANYATTITNALALKAPLASPGFTGSPTAPTVGTASDNSTKLATTAFVQAALALLGFPRDYIAGLQTSAAGGTTSYSIGAGAAVSDDGALMMVPASAFTKSLAAWAVGSGNGSLDTGALAINTWYYVYIIERTDTSVVDFLCSTSSSAPTLPTNYTKKRRIGAFKTDGSANIKQFTQNGDRFIWGTQIGEVNTGVGSGARTLVTLAGVPPLASPAMAILQVALQNTGSETTYLIVTDPAQPDTTPSSANFTLYIPSTASGIIYNSGLAEVRTNSSAQVGYAGNNGGPRTVIINTRGWIDRRGQDT